MAGVAEGPQGDKQQLDELVRENLKALRLLHQVLMVAATAVLAFALRPDHSDDYRAALGELSALQEVSFDDWGHFIEDRYKKDADQNDTLARKVLRQAGLPIQDQLRLGQPVYGDPPPYVGTARLIDLDSFIAGLRKIGVPKLSAKKQTVAVEQLRRAPEVNKGRSAVVGLVLSMAGEIPLANGVRMIDWRNPSPVPQAPLHVYFGGQPVATNVAVEYSIFSESGHFALEWLRKETFGQKLVDSNTGVVFPRLKLFWDRVATHSVGEATLLLQEELASNARGTLSFFGIPVERSLAVSAGPAVCFSILLFLCLHVRHFRIFVGGYDINGFPWVPLFRGPLNLVVTGATLVILPVVANGELLRRYGHWSEPSTGIGTAFTVLILVMGVWAFIEIHKLRARAR